MKKSEENNKTNSKRLENDFLKEKGTISASDYHKEYLGMDVPEDYFQTSKTNILDAISKKKQTPVFYLRRPFQIAASLTILVCLSIVIRMSSVEDLNDFEIASNDILIESLFVEDIDMNTFVNDIVVNEIVVEAEMSEQDLENIFINSLFVDDSLLDDYMKKSVLNNIIL